MTATARALPKTDELIFDTRKSTAIRRVVEVLKYILLLALAISFAFPFYWMVVTALKDDPQVYTLPPVLIPNPAHWDNFIKGWTFRYDFTQFAINSIFRYALPVTLFTVISSVISAYGFARLKWWGRDFFFFLCMGTMMIPWQVTMVPLFITYKQLGWLNSYLPLVVPSLFGAPYFIFLLRQFFMGLPEELSDAARIDGASEFGILVRIILPLAVPAMAVVALFRFLGAWNDYLGPLIYANREDLFTLAVGLYRLNVAATAMGTTGNAQPYLMAVSTVVAAPVVLMFFLAQRTFIEGISMTGLKG
ncbi:MAG TPA: carbohydrate ABC transporter permease [Anaerolinea sp.]|nr:carbohydrate ABC transporter permease [Anaerolinea sp.]